MAESRSELLNWLNETLDLNYTKIEQCGTGAAYCQLFDSIYGDVPMSRVRFSVEFEYEFLQNYKILQQILSKHNISKTVYVERLSKCKLQDNLEFLQWIRKFWLEHKDETVYDPNARRKGPAGSAGPAKAGATGSAGSAGSAGARTIRGTRPVASASTTQRRAVNGGSGTGSSSANGSRGASRVAGAARGPVAGAGSAVKSTLARNGTVTPQATRLQKQLTETQEELSAALNEAEEYKLAAEGLETERNFYFNKLREIEILSQAITDKLSEEAEKYHKQQLNGSEPGTNVIAKNQGLIEFVEKVQDILYSTEEGFQLPEVDENEFNGDVDGDGDGDVDVDVEVQAADNDAESF